MKKIILILIFLLPVRTNSGTITYQMIINDYNNSQRYYYNLYIERLQKDEGFSNHVYEFPKGFRTIGYGHLLKSNESFTYLTKEQSLELLKQDFNEALEYVKHLPTKKKFAAAHFIFCLGIGTYSKIKDFKNEVLKYCYYYSNNKFVFSKLAYERRKFEYDNY